MKLLLKGLSTISLANILFILMIILKEIIYLLTIIGAIIYIQFTELMFSFRMLNIATNII